MRSMQNKFKSLSLFLFAISLLSACGGGGSGGSTPPAPPTPPVPPAPPPPLVVDYSENASIAALSSVDSLLQIAYVSTNTVFNTASIRSGAELSCGNGGILSHQLVDNDTNLRLSAGDRLTTTYRECFVDALQAVADGSISYTITSLTSGDGYKVVLNASALNIDNSISLAGNLIVDYNIDDFGTNLSISSQDSLEVSSDNQLLLTLSDLSISKAELYTQAKYSITARGNIKDEYFGATYSFKQNTPFSGYFNEFPNDGALEISTSDTDK